ncbi:M23 family metallopeptidase [Streptomyces sp. F001]|uniref:M23 family metallopeptidase n=1 Tax=Streptomyces sp. F001 TaxID=1510026 RepID=UPI00101E5E00|nr:M23 family metallopeptidase [Streptomyces sp. F001]RZB18438.1 M23 family metallopeptidase [Streptomyces sp. F001]
MRSSRRCPLLVSVLLCAFALLAARPAEESRHGPEDGRGNVGVGTEVAQLYEETAVATQQYEEGRREARVQRARARRLEGLLDRERREIAVLREDLGRLARAQYRTGGDLPLTARMILADDPEKLMEREHAVRKADLVVDNAIDKSRRAETRLAADEARAAAAWQDLEKRNAELAKLKKSIEQKLEEARWRLQGQANASARAGACRGAVRLDQPKLSFTRDWVAPLKTYVLSAGFGTGGARWANRHTGQDFAVPIGTPVRAVGEGRVMRVSCGGAFGIEIVIEHPGGYYTQYAHLASVAVDQGDRVLPGQWIGQSGTTGNSTGPHLHFEVRVAPELGSGVDPVRWLAARGVEL